MRIFLLLLTLSVCSLDAATYYRTRFINAGSIARQVSILSYTQGNTSTPKPLVGANEWATVQPGEAYIYNATWYNYGPGSGLITGIQHKALNGTDAKDVPVSISVPYLGDSTTIYYIDITFNGPSTATNCLGKITVYNGTSVDALYCLLRNGEQTGIQARVGSGKQYTFEFSVPNCDFSDTYTVNELLSYDGSIESVDESIYFGDGQFGNNAGGGLNIGTNNVSPTDPAPGNYTSTTGNGLTPFNNTYSNSLDNTGNPIGPISYTGTNQTAARDTTLQTGFNAVRDGLAGGLGEVVNELNELQDINRSGFNNLTNDSGGTGTITGAVWGASSSLSNAIATFHQDNTNLLGQILSTITNGTSTNINVPLTATNGQAAVSQATTLVSEATTAGDNFLGSVTSIPLPDEGGGSMGGAMTIQMVGETINLDPREIIPGSDNLSKAIASFLIIAAFLIEVSMLYRDLAKSAGLLQTGGVPNVQMNLFGTGGNVLGVAMAAVIPLAFCAIYVVTILTFFSVVTGALPGITMPVITGAMNVGAALNSLPSIAKVLITSYFPVNLLASIVMSRIVIHFTAAKSLMLAGIASRFLFGK